MGFGSRQIFSNPMRRTKSPIPNRMRCKNTFEIPHHNAVFGGAGTLSVAEAAKNVFVRMRACDCHAFERVLLTTIMH